MQALDLLRRDTISAGRAVFFSRGSAVMFRDGVQALSEEAADAEPVVLLRVQRRTINGKSYSPAQMAAIVAAALNGEELPTNLDCIEDQERAAHAAVLEAA